MEQLKPTPDHALARPDMAINAGLRGIENKMALGLLVLAGLGHFRLAASA